MRSLILTVLLAVSGSSAISQVRINAGGPSTGDFLSDRFFTGGTAWTAPTPIPGAPAIYNTVRYGNLSYNVPLSAPGKYEVTIHFAEVNTAVAVGQRVMNILVNDQPFLSNFDIVMEAGGTLKPISRKITVDATATLRITLQTVVKNAMINAIEIIAVQTPPPPPTGEGEWCPGPVLTRVDDKTFIIGKNWSPTSTCFLHNSLASLQQLTTPFTVTAIPEFNGDDLLMIFITFTPSPVVNVATRSLTSWSCTTPCQIVNSGLSLSKMFPANSVPVGAWNYRQGKLDPVAHAILGTHQIYIGGSIGLVVERNTNGWLFNLQTVPAQWNFRIERWLNIATQKTFTPQCAPVPNVPYEVYRNGLLQSPSGQTGSGACVGQCADYVRSSDNSVVFLDYTGENGQVVVVPQPGDSITLKYWTTSCPTGDFLSSGTMTARPPLAPPKLIPSQVKSK